MSIDEKKLIDVIGEMYEGAAADSNDGWDKAYRSLSSLFSSGPGSLQFFLHDEQKFDPLADTNEPGFIEKLNKDLFPIAPFRSDILRLKPGEIFLMTSRYPGDGFKHDPFYRDHFKKNDIFRVLHLCLIENETTTAGISFTRPETMPDFSFEEIRALREITPHLQRAVNLHIEIVGRRERERLVLNMLDGLHQPLIVTDQKARVVVKNDAAEAYFGVDGILTLERDGSLGCSTPRYGHELRALISAAFGPSGAKGMAFGGVMGMLTKSSNRPVSVMVSPFSERYGISGGSKRFALLMIADPTGRIPTLQEDLRMIYDLTKKEAEIAILLAEGKTISEISDALGTSLNTVRTHVKHVFGKVGTNRQASLVRYVLSASRVRNKSQRLGSIAAFFMATVSCGANLLFATPAIG
ncbi:MAG: helix-turn-helix transcriptional regulator [Pyrinomonadaceae bacterium]|nr:helix-turn-helix transcriptional regulator [Pyrinomonadaceae bacterium]